MPLGSVCSSAMLLPRNNRQPQGNTRDHWHHFAPKVLSSFPRYGSPQVSRSNVFS
jgi:hypothetical protein